jgi:hypothetical protein
MDSDEVANSRISQFYKSVSQLNKLYNLKLKFIMIKNAHQL